MWLLNWLPDWIFYLALFVGAISVVSALFLIKQIPFVSKYQTPMMLLGILLVVAGIWFAGGIAKDQQYQREIANLRVKIAQAEQQAAETNTKIEYVYRDRVEVVEKVRYKVISAIRESSNEIDANCQVNPAAVDILNQAAESPQEKK